MSDDVVIVVAAQDKATRILQEIGKQGNILARQIVTAAAKTGTATKTFTSNVASFAGGVKKFVQETATIVQGMASKFAKAMQAMQASMRVFTFIIEGIQFLKESFSGFGDSIEAFNTQDKAVRKLAKSIDLLGGNSAESIDKHKQFAAELQNSTNIGDEYTLGLMAQASAMGIHDEQLQEVTKGAIGLAQATGITSEEALKKMHQAVTGNANALNELIPGIINARTQQEKLAMVNEVATRGLGLAATTGLTLQGSMDRASGAFGDFQEKIGELLAPIQMLINEGFAVFYETMQSAVQPAIDASKQAFASLAPIMNTVATTANAMATVIWAAISSVVEVIQSWTGGFLESGDTINSIATGITGVVEWLAQSAIKAISFIEVTIRNLPEVWELAMTSIEYYLTKFVNDVKYAFTEGSTQYLFWFATNMYNLIRDAFNAMATAVSNFTTNAANAIGALWDWVSSGFEGGPSALMESIGESMGNGLLDGFESSLTPLPSLAQRQATETEKLLSASMTQLAGTLSEDLESTYNARVANLGVATKQKLENMNVGLELAKGQVDAVTAQTNNQLQAFESRLLTRGSGGNPTDKIAKNTEQTNKLLQEVPQMIAQRLAPLIPSEAQGDFWSLVSMAQ